MSRSCRQYSASRFGMRKRIGFRLWMDRGTAKTEAFMVQRIGLWGLAGLTVALIWAAVFYLAGPSNGTYPSQDAVSHYLGHGALVPLTAPVALLGRHYAITWYSSAVINGGMYALAGLVVETIRRAVHSSRLRLNH